MLVIPFASLKPQPWRNGGGSTREIASGGSAASPDWRLSIADLEKPGEFSAFPGMERTFMVIEGEVAELTVDGTVRRLERFRPLRFDGASAASCALPTGPCRALNVMVRSGAAGAGVLVAELSKKQPLTLAEGQFAVLLQGKAEAAEGSQTDHLAPFDTVAGGAASAGATHGVTVGGRGFAALISIFALDATE
jgi:uncharacterized protein